MIYPIVPFPVTLSDLSARFQGHGVIFMPIDALSVFCAQLTRDLLAIAKFLKSSCDDWYTVGTVLVDMWRSVHQWSFLLFWLSFDCFWRMVHCTSCQKHSKPLVYRWSQVYQKCTNSVPVVKNSQKTVKTAQNDHWCTNRHMSTKTVPTVYHQYHRQKQSKDSQNSQNSIGCTNRHRFTKTVPTV